MHGEARPAGRPARTTAPKAMAGLKQIIAKTQGTERKVDVYRALKNAIQFLALEPGSVLAEADLVTELGVSRTPIREALIRLEDDALVNIYPQRGTYVAKISLPLAKEMAYMRHVLETEIAADLCRRKADLRDATAESMFLMRQALKKKDIIEYILNDDAFHRSIFAAAGREPIWNVISATRAHYIRVLMLDLTLPSTLEESYQDHERIVQLVGRGALDDLLAILNTHHDHTAMKREPEILAKFRSYFA